MVSIFSSSSLQQIEEAYFLKRELFFFFLSYCHISRQQSKTASRLCWSCDLCLASPSGVSQCRRGREQYRTICSIRVGNGGHMSHHTCKCLTILHPFSVSHLHTICLFLSLSGIHTVHMPQFSSAAAIQWIVYISAFLPQPVCLLSVNVCSISLCSIPSLQPPRPSFP